MRKVSPNRVDVSPGLGVVKGSVFVVALSLFVAYTSDTQFYNVWAGFMGICTIPALIVMTSVYLSETNLGWLQPRRFLILTSIISFTALVIGLVAHLLFPSFSEPNLAQSTWVSLGIIVAVFHIYVFDLWPLQSISEKYLQRYPSVLAILELLFIYLIAYLLLAFVRFDAPSHPILGTFVASTYGIDVWHVLAFGYTALLVNAILALFDITGSDALVGGWPSLRLQPLRGIIFFTFVAILTGSILSVFSVLSSYHESFYLAVFVIPSLMAVFLIQENTGYQWYVHQFQPIRGVILSLSVLVLSIILFYIYQQASTQIAGLDKFFTPSFGKEFWMMNTMLSVGYPLIIIYCHFIKPVPL